MTTRSANVGVLRLLFRCSMLWALLSFSATLDAADLTIKVQVPRIAVAEYHRPFVAIWVETAEEQKVFRNLAVWYQLDIERDDSWQWLQDLRQWWRRGGRDSTKAFDGKTGATQVIPGASRLRVAPSMPIDGVTGATRPVGEHTLVFRAGTVPLGTLAAGKYNLVIEAVREAGGRELLRIPFEWPAQRSIQATAQGKSELGRIVLSVNP